METIVKKIARHQRNLVVLVLALPLLTAASYPGWWTRRTVIDPVSVTNDFAVVNQGQAKHIASRAYDEFQAGLAGGAGSNLTAAMQPILLNPLGGTNDAPMNVGQLKNLALPFYDRLIAIGYTNAYPWTSFTEDDQDFAPANVGQLKNLFGFELDADNDGLPDFWERNHFGGIAANPNDDDDHDGLTNTQECALGTDPRSTDSDGDGALDGDEINFLHTDPLAADTDGDGIADGWEVRYGLNPTNSFDSLGDRDGDGIPDVVEYALHTSPMDCDSDDDGLPDDWESVYSSSMGGGGFDPATGLRDLVGWWRFDSPGVWYTNVVSGPVTNTMVRAIYEWDSGPYALHASLHPSSLIPQPFPTSITNSLAAGNPTWGTPSGDAQRSWKTTGLTTNPVLSIPAHPILSGSSNGWSAAFWIKFANASSQPLMDLLCFAETNSAIRDPQSAISPQAPFRVQMDSAQRILANINLLGTNSQPFVPTLSSGMPLPATIWTHVAVTHAASSGISCLYVNTNLVVAVTNSWLGNSALRTPNSALKILPQLDARTPQLDSLRLYGHALSTNELSEIIAPSEPVGDADGDGLTNWQERVNYSNPLIVDTDGDGLGDSNEVFVTHTLPYAADSDGDGISDFTETSTYISNFGSAHYTSPIMADTDGDGLFDSEEINTHHSNPLRGDTDGDGMTDGWEIRFGLNPNDSTDGAQDADGDGIANSLEYQRGTSPLIRDSNSNGIGDKEESTLAAAVPADLPVTDHGGADWIISASAKLTGRHINVGLFQVSSNVTVSIPTNSVGRLWVEAQNISVFGTINADGAGHPGATAVGAGGTRGRIVRNGVGGALVSTNRATAGQRGFAAPASPDFNSATNGGYAGISGNVQTGVSGGVPIFPTNVTVRSGGQGNYNDTVGGRIHGGYSAPGTLSNGDTTTDYSLKRGGGGGSGGGGGGAETLDVTTNTNNLYYAVTGGKGGDGQPGGNGGGAIWLFAVHTNLVQGPISARGLYPTQPIKMGTEITYGPGAGSYYTSGQKPGASAGPGGVGGGGGGGGILLRGKRVEITSYMQVTGSGGSGTIKLFGQTVITNSAALAYGRLLILAPPDLDSDGDGIPDSQETINGTNPNINDTDGDGVSDRQEQIDGTNPLLADTDGDGMDDGFERIYGLNPNSAADANLDTDGDGKSNLIEAQNGTSPIDALDGSVNLFNAYIIDNRLKTMLPTEPPGTEEEVKTVNSRKVKVPPGSRIYLTSATNKMDWIGDTAVNLNGVRHGGVGTVHADPWFLFGYPVDTAYDPVPAIDVTSEFSVGTDGYVNISAKLLARMLTPTSPAGQAAPPGQVWGWIPVPGGGGSGNWGWYTPTSTGGGGGGGTGTGGSAAYPQPNQGTRSGSGTATPSQPSPPTHASTPTGKTKGSREVWINVLPPPKIQIAVDANRDGAVKFDNTDQTDSTNRFTFWVNDDVDVAHVVDGTDWDEDDVETGPSDFKDGLILCRRDLEDFQRIWIKVDQDLQADDQVVLKWEDVPPSTPQPSINIYPAAEANGGAKYLTDDSVKQIFFGSHNVNPDKYCSKSIATISDSTEVVVPLPPGGAWKKDQPRYYLFEGAAKGKGTLHASIRRGTQPIPQDPQISSCKACVELKDVKDMYERWTVGDQSGGEPGGLKQEGTAYGPPTATGESSYILLVHGWNMEPWEKERFAETAFKRLYWQGYKGRFGLFKWPTTNRFAATAAKEILDPVLDPQNYNEGEFTAWRSAEGLKQLFVKLNIRDAAAYRGKVYVVAHSMGNVVTGEALRRAAQAQLGVLVNTYVASQAAVPAHAYQGDGPDSMDAVKLINGRLRLYYNNPKIPDLAESQALIDLGNGLFDYGPETPNVYRNWLQPNAAAVGKRVNFYNANDFALSAPAWEFNQIMKPKLMGDGHVYYCDGDPQDETGWEQRFFYLVSAMNGIDLRFTLDGGSQSDPKDRYRIMAFGSEARSKALGSTEGNAGMTGSVNLRTVWGTDPAGNEFADHKWHSAQFRSTNAAQKTYWKALLGTDGFQIQ